MAVNQLIGEKEVTAKTGIIVVVLSFAALFLLSALFSILSSLGAAPLITSTLFWLSGGAIALFVFQRFVVRYLYTLDGVKLVVERVYSRKPRYMEQVLLREIIFIGKREDAVSKYKDLKIKKAIRTTNTIEPVCVVFKRSGEIKAVLIQPNEEILSSLREAAANNRK